MSVLAAVLDLICPASCLGCQAPGRLACDRCLAPLAASPRLVRPVPCPPGMPATFAVARYEGAARDLLLGYKEREAAALAPVLAAPLGAAVAAVIGSGPEGLVLLVPVPSSPRAVRQRGEDVVQVLARRAAAMVRTPERPIRVVPALTQARVVADSAGLGAAARLANLDRALVVRPGSRRVVAGARIVIVDDLVTTGATLVEAHRALRAAGADVVGAATVAATQRRHF